MSGDVCDRCGDPATTPLASGEAYCDECAEWRWDIDLESKGFDTSSPDDLRRAALAVAKAEAEQQNRRWNDANLCRQQRNRKQAGARTESSARTGPCGASHTER